MYAHGSRFVFVLVVFAMLAEANALLAKDRAMSPGATVAGRLRPVPASGAKATPLVREGKHCVEAHGSMVKRLRSQGIREKRNIAAKVQIQRQRFVPANHQYSSYADTPLQIGHGQKGQEKQS
jgi:hypothetical protein